MKKRLDVLLVEKGYFSTRSKAALAIKSGDVFAGGKLISKAGEEIDEEIKIEISAESNKYVSRGGLKLEGMLKEGGVSLENKTIVDLGASTGGFVDCALMHGAKKVFAVDVGSNQLDKKLLCDMRVVSMEKTDCRKISKEIFDECDLVTADLSFISIVKVLKELYPKLKDGMELICLIKPQFECGLEIARRCGGVIKSEKEAKEICERVVFELEALGYKKFRLISSPIKGGDGNREFVVYLKKQNGHD